MIPTPTTTNVERLCAPACMTYEKRPIRQISRNMQEFQAAIFELADAVAGSARITAYLELGDGSIPTSGLPTIQALSRAKSKPNSEYVRFYKMMLYSQINSIARKRA